MSATMEIPFALGEELWSTGNRYRQDLVTCPECAGTKVILMVKGNGESVSLDCAHCSGGFEPPTGTVKVTTFLHEPTKFIPRRVHMSGDDFAYSESLPSQSSYTFQYAKDLYRSREECEARCIAMNAERAAGDERRAIANISSKRNGLAFSASYWTGQVRRLRDDLARAEARLARCKAKP